MWLYFLPAVSLLFWKRLKEMERHPVDGNRNGAVLIVEMVDMVRGAETRRHTCCSSLYGEESEQCKPEY